MKEEQNSPQTAWTLPQLLGYLVGLGKRYWYVVLLLAALGVLGGWWYFSVQDKVYKGKTVVEIKYLSGNKTLILVNELNLLLEANEVSQVSKLLGVEKKQVENLETIEATPSTEIKDFIKNEKFNQEEGAITITILHQNPQAIPAIKEKIFEYLRNAPLAEKNLKLDKGNLRYLIQQTQREIQVQDSLRRQLTRQTGKSGVVFSTGTEANQALKLHQELRSFKSQLEEAQIVQPVMPLVVYQEAFKPKKWSLVIGGFLGILVALLYIAYAEYKRSQSN